MKRLVLSAVTLFGIMSAYIANAQGISIVITGKADLSFPDDYSMVVTCTEEGTCAKITGGSDGHLHLLNPDHRLDLVLMSSNVNGQPAETLPSQMPNGTYQFDVDNSGHSE